MTEESAETNQLDVPMLLARIEEDDALIAGLRHRCAALLCEVKMLRRVVGEQAAQAGPAKAAAEAALDLASSQDGAEGATDDPRT